uniref:AlNc14C288G10200 protein n=1 Tax=Albugo laibachii Nc14 TaxID=890382 RepID=F0WV55_9STRA|nr:AlNc14C288G10200 [Albugo laibachii Nc14]|eukprot:CCA25294.1 AlNc14C288G10200 [Albugo laibachii Nc14]
MSCFSHSTRGGKFIASEKKKILRSALKPLRFTIHTFGHHCYCNASQHCDRIYWVGLLLRPSTRAGWCVVCLNAWNREKTMKKKKLAHEERPFYLIEPISNERESESKIVLNSVAAPSTS